MEPIKCYMPRKAQEVLSAPNKRYRILRGGRGSGKSYAVANYLLIKALSKNRILCTREFQMSIRDSVHRLLSDRISDLGLDKYFVIQRDNIYSIFGSEFIFRGLKNNPSEIKSMQGINYVWIEEAEGVSEASWTYLIPTIREPNSEILITYNPETENCETDKRFCKNIPPDCAWAEVNFGDNELFPEVLDKERLYDKRIDYEKYEHIWLGKYKRYADALIFKNKVRVEAFETPQNVQFHLGSDFGYSVDPSVLVRMFIKDFKLYIDKEAYGVGVEISQLHKFFATVPESNRWQTVADSARPDTISFLSQYYKDKDGIEYPGYDIVGAEKGKGSVEDGIEFLRSFEQIIIHPDCRGSIDNFSNYRWKQDPITKAILPIPEKGNDHVPDACRYGLERYIKQKVSVFDLNYKQVGSSNLMEFLKGNR